MKPAIWMAAGLLAAGTAGAAEPARLALELGAEGRSEAAAVEFRQARADPAHPMIARVHHQHPAVRRHRQSPQE